MLRYVLCLAVLVPTLSFAGQISEIFRGTTTVTIPNGATTSSQETLVELFPTSSDGSCDPSHFKVISIVDGAAPVITYYDEPQVLPGPVFGMSYRTTLNGIVIGQMPHYGTPCDWTSASYNEIVCPCTDGPKSWTVGSAGYVGTGSNKVFVRSKFKVDSSGRLLSQVSSNLKLVSRKISH